MRGSVTIYVTLIFTVVLSFICILIEGARSKVVYTKLRNITTIATESAMAEYSRELFEDYGVMFCVEPDVEKYINLNVDYLSKLYNVDVEKVDVKTGGNCIEGNGKTFKQQVYEHTKNIIPSEFISYMKEQIGKSSGIQSYNPKELEQGSEDVKVIGKLVSKINKNFDKISKVTYTPQKDISKIYKMLITKENKWNKHIKKVRRTVQKQIKKVDKLIEDTIVCIQEYKQLEAEVAVKYAEDKSYENDSYIDKNYTVLKDTQIVIEEINNVLDTFDMTITKDNLEEYKKNTSKLIKTSNDYNLRLHKVSAKEYKGESVVDYIQNVNENGKLSLVVKDVNSISKNTIEKEQLPSIKDKCDKSNSDSLEEQILFAYYINNYFGCYTENKDITSLKYEMEYILVGNEDDRSNLSDIVDQLVLLRQGFNVVHILSDSQKQNESTTMATTLVGWMGLPVVTFITKMLIVAAWGYGEAIIDVKNLLSGKKVQILKKAENWNLSLKGLASLSSDTESEGDSKGMTYEEYLLLLLVTRKQNDIVFRTMDLIQLNINKRYNVDFKMESCISSITVTAEYNYNRLFPSIGFVNQFSVNKTGQY